MEKSSSTSVFSLIAVSIVSFLAAMAYFSYNIQPRQYEARFFPIKQQYISQKGVHTSVIEMLSVRYKSRLKADSIMANSEIQPEVARILPFESLYFNYNPEFLIWIVLSAMMFSGSMAFFLVMKDQIGYLMKVFRLKTTDLIVTGLASALIVAIIGYINSGNSNFSSLIQLAETFQILLADPHCIYYFILFAISVGGTGIAGVLMISFCAGKLETHAKVKFTETVSQKHLANFQLLKRSLNLFLTCITVLTVFFIVTTNALRTAITHEITVNIPLFPVQVVYVYGLICSAFLAILYVPVYQHLKLTGEKLYATYGKNPDNEAFLTKDSAWQSVKMAFAVLAPLLSSLAGNWM